MKTEIVVDTRKQYCDCGNRTYVILVNGVYAGRTCVVPTSWYSIELRHVFIVPEYRRMGLGMQLIQHLISITDKPFVSVTVRCDNHPARAMMRKIGFRLVRKFRSAISGKDCVLLIYHTQRRQLWQESEG